MKKLAIGCGLIVVVLAIGATIGVYWVASKAKSYVGQLTAYAELDKGVTRTAAFSPPGNGELTEEMLKRFAAVQDSMHARLGARVEEIKNREDEFMRREQAEHRKATPAENFTVITDLMTFIVEAKNAWVDALNQQHFSIDEYYWVRGRVYTAAGLNIMELSLRNMQQAMKEGGNVVRPIESTSDPASQHDKALVAPYLPKLEDWAVFAFFGL
jgi:hypothetical protein